MARNESLLLLCSRRVFACSKWMADLLLTTYSIQTHFNGLSIGIRWKKRNARELNVRERSTFGMGTVVLRFFHILFLHRFRSPDSCDPSIENC